MDKTKRKKLSAEERKNLLDLIIFIILFLIFMAVIVSFKR